MMNAEAIVEWVREADEYAEHRLPLMRRAQRVLAGEEELRQAERQDLAERLQIRHNSVAGLTDRCEQGLRSSSPHSRRRGATPFLSLCCGRCRAWVRRAP